MIPATTNFNSKVDDGVTPQNFIISFDAGITLSSENGDFTSNGITIMRELGCGDDYSFGAFPSSVLSFSAYNYNNRFNNFAWGQCTVSVECDGETVPIGIFNVEKPAKVMTEIVNVTDAYDNAKKLDVEITEHIRSITYPISIKDLFYSVLTYCGIGYHTFPTNCLNADYSVIENPLGETGTCSARKMLKWIGEFCLLNFRIAEDGKVRYQNASSSTTAYKEYGDTKIASGGYEIAEFSTAHPDKLIVKNAAGLSYVDGDGDNIYSIISNPWHQDLTMISLSDISDKCPVYHPSTYSVIEADPCIECGDLISFTLNGITNTMPIMSQTIAFTGRKTSAIYGSTGNAIRSNDETIENLDYSINVANNTGNIIKAIYAHGIDADYITTGKITDRDGNYSLDLETGTVNMANANITGGKIDIETSSATIDKIAFRLNSSSIDYEMLMSVNRIQSDAKFHRFDADGNPLDGYGTEMRSSLGYGGASANVVFKDADGNESGNYTTTISGTRISTLKSVNGNSHTISELGSDGSTTGNPQLTLYDPNNGSIITNLNNGGLSFYDGGKTTASYPANNTPVLLFDSGYMEPGSDNLANKSLSQPYTNFRFILITCGFYGSVSTTILEPVYLFASHNSGGNRIDIQAGNNAPNTYAPRASIYVTGSTTFMLLTFSHSANYSVKIYGIY